VNSALTFVNSPLLWGLAALAIPVLIHLINLLRHRRVPWAAMEFLLASVKKNTRWIRLRELLLLLLRLAAVAAVVLIVARPQLRSRLAGWFGGGRTHHLVLLDDSYSMQDRWGDTNAFDEGRRVVRRLAEQAALQPASQLFTLLRFSRCGRPGGRTEPDLLAERVDRAFGQRMVALLEDLQPSQHAAQPGPALKAIEQLLSDRVGEEHAVYVVSDFRAAQWEEPGELARVLLRLQQAGVRLHLVHCVDAAHGNLAVTRLAPRPGILAAGVPLLMEVTVKNYSSERASGVSVLVEEDQAERPAVEIGDLEPGESATRRFPAFFATAGEHVVKVSLPPDGVPADNTRFALIELPLSVPVLLVDGDPEALQARFLATALAPGGPVKTGVDPLVEGPTYLNRQPLERYRAIYLLNIDRLDEAALQAVEAYVRGGGGVAFFVGDRTRAEFCNQQLYRDGEGWLPLPLVGSTPLVVDRLERSPDVAVTDHPLFRIFAGERNTFLSSVIIERYFKTQRDWEPPPRSSVRVLARVRNGDPLIVERTYGKGRVVAVLTTASPEWNNWGRNPSFVVLALELQAYLSKSWEGEELLVGSPLRLADLDASHYQPRVQVFPPGAGTERAITLDALPSAASAAAGETAAGTSPPAQPAAERGRATMRFEFPDTDLAGIYEVRLSTTAAAEESRYFAVNVDPGEGDLATLHGRELAERLPGVKFDYRPATEFRLAHQDPTGSELSQWLLYALIAVLIGEQLLAYVASYHPPAAEATR
jgi:hypothetical protein